MSRMFHNSPITQAMFACPVRRHRRPVTVTGYGNVTDLPQPPGKRATSSGVF
jgi:hypothetical protein